MGGLCWMSTHKFARAPGALCNFLVSLCEQEKCFCVRPISLLLIFGVLFAAAQIAAKQRANLE
jgi:hypothetical protein